MILYYVSRGGETGSIEQISRRSRSFGNSLEFSTQNALNQLTSVTDRILYIDQRFSNYWDHDELFFCRNMLVIKSLTWIVKIEMH